MRKKEQPKTDDGLQMSPSHSPSAPSPPSSPRQAFLRQGPQVSPRLRSCPHPSPTILQESAPTQSRPGLLPLFETLSGSPVPSGTGPRGPFEASLAGFSGILFSYFPPRTLRPDSSAFLKLGCPSCSPV